MLNLEVIHKMHDANTDVNDFLALMFENTDEDGTLYLPFWSRDSVFFDHDRVFRCQIDWDINWYEKAVVDFHHIHNTLKQIAAIRKELGENLLQLPHKLPDETHRRVHNLYCTPLADGVFDTERIWDIGLRADMAEEAKVLKAQVAAGIPLDQDAWSVLKMVVNTSVSEQDIAYLEAYCHLQDRQATQRMGEGIAPYDVYKNGHSLYRAYCVEASEEAVNRLTRLFAAAFVLHRHGLSREEVSLKD